MQELRHLVDIIPAMVWVALPYCSNTYVNDRYVDYSDMTAAQTAVSGWRAAAHPADLQRHEGRWRASIASGEPHQTPWAQREESNCVKFQRRMPLDVQASRQETSNLLSLNRLIDARFDQVEQLHLRIVACELTRKFPGSRAVNRHIENLSRSVSHSLWIRLIDS